MPNNNTNDTVRRVLETAVEVIGIIIMILPLFQSQGRKKTK